MNGYDFTFCGNGLCALPSGALHWPERSLLVVSDMHLGKSARLSAIGGAQLPPYEVRDTLTKLETDIAVTNAQTIICLGDTFDTPNIETTLREDEQLWITRLQAGRTWVWIEGNHDPGPVALGGSHVSDISFGTLTFRHIATSAQGEVSGHYHPKARVIARGRGVARPCFLVDRHRLILPAYGTYTGGLWSHSKVLDDLMAPGAMAILTGKRALPIPMPRS